MNGSLWAIKPRVYLNFAPSALLRISGRLPVAATDLTGNPANRLLSVCIWIPHSSITAQSELGLWGVQKRCSGSIHGNLEQRKSNYVKKQSTATNLPDKLFFADCGNRFAELNQLQQTIIWLLFYTWIVVLYHGYSYELEGQVSSTSVCGNQSAGRSNWLPMCGNWSAELNQLQRPSYERWCLLISQNQISRITVLCIVGNSCELDCQLSSTSVSGNRCAGEATGCRLC